MSEEKIDIASENRRRRRINRIKKIIIGLVIVSIVVPTILSGMLMVKVVMLEKEIEKLRAAAARAEFVAGEPITQVQQTQAVISEQIQQTQPAISETESTTEAEYFEIEDVDEKAENSDIVEDNNDGIKRVYLTFDDGPSESTDAILDILARYNVKATFFVIIKDDEKSIRRYNRIVEEGHTLAMHSYTHAYNQIYADLESFKKDVLSSQQFLYEVTGVKPVIYRFPGGSSNTVMNVDIYECIDFLKEQGITYFDWNVSSGDAIGNEHVVEDLTNNVLEGAAKHDEAVVLMHDASSKKATVSALPVILEKFLAMEDVALLPLTEESYPVQHTRR